MDKEQEMEWMEAQKIEITVDLVAAVKRQLTFLAAVDRNRCLYDVTPALHMAIHRYNVYWLPLLAKHHEMQLTEGPLVVPLDCEWIWHCHRLNPIRYKMDCVKFHGRILDNSKVVSSTEGASKTETERVWEKLFPEEPYELDLSITDVPVKDLKAVKFTDYDLLAAVQRQSPFYYQVARPYVNTDLFLKEALARYKGFLHLIRSNRERSIRRFCVPTYDIDLLWHTHQLHSVSYCENMVKLLGKILEHDDMDADRSKGTKLDVGFSGTTKQWEESFGTRYWKAGAMYRGSAPTPVTKSPYPFKTSGKKTASTDEGHKILQLPELKYVEVFVEIVDVKNLPEKTKGSPYVICSKKQPDAIFISKRNLRISSLAGEKYLASFQCEPTGEIHFELMLQKHSHLPLTKQFRPLGSASFSLSEFIASGSALSLEKWLELVPSSANDSLKPVELRIALSFTLPLSAPYVLQIVHAHSFLQKTCFFPKTGKLKQSKSWTSIVDEAGEEILSLRMSDSTNGKVGERTVLKEILGLQKSGEVQSLAQQTGSTWVSADNQWSLKKSSDSAYLFDLVGTRVVRFYLGRKLEYEPSHCAKRRSEVDFITAVEFSSENPYGTAVALFELKSGIITVKQEWFMLPGTILGFIVIEMLKKEGFGSLSVGGGNNVEIMSDVTHVTDKICLQNKNVEASMISELNQDLTGVETVMLDKETVNSGGCGGCGAGCGGGCRSMVNSGGCGGCGGGLGGDMVKSGGCGGCGGGCGGCGGGLGGNMVKSGGCGGCGGGCGGCGGGLGGNMVKSGGCGGCGGGCGGCGGGLGGNMVKSGGCGGCGGGCGGCGGGLEGNISATDGNATFCGGSGGCGGCGGGCGGGLGVNKVTTDGTATFCEGSGACGGRGGRSLVNTEESASGCGGSGGCGGCGGACGVNSTHQTHTGTSCN